MRHGLVEHVCDELLGQDSLARTCCSNNDEAPGLDEQVRDFLVACRGWPGILRRCIKTTCVKPLQHHLHGILQHVEAVVGEWIAHPRLYRVHQEGIALPRRSCEAWLCHFFPEAAPEAFMLLKPRWRTCPSHLVLDSCCNRRCQEQCQSLPLREVRILLVRDHRGRGCVQCPQHLQVRLFELEPALPSCVFDIAAPRANERGEVCEVALHLPGKPPDASHRGCAVRRRPWQGLVHHVLGSTCPQQHEATHALLLLFGLHIFGEAEEATRQDLCEICKNMAFSNRLQVDDPQSVIRIDHDVPKVQVVVHNGFEGGEDELRWQTGFHGTVEGGKELRRWNKGASRPLHHLCQEVPSRWRLRVLLLLVAQESAILVEGDQAIVVRSAKLGGR
mmetsp:Transcript_43151/g.101391  ORF Transcript_43151/g.101391 Transcript_43151/m.101391 type:complete len:389 (-) Transcript_43151:1108-2274(-)